MADFIPTVLVSVPVLLLIVHFLISFSAFPNRIRALLCHAFSSSARNLPLNLAARTLSGMKKVSSRRVFSPLFSVSPPPEMTAWMWGWYKSS